MCTVCVCVLDYQPGWTMVGGGLKPAEFYRRKEKDLMPNGIDWHQSNVVSFDPDNNSVELANGKKLNYDFMIVSTGIHINFDGVSLWSIKEHLNSREINI